MIWLYNDRKDIYVQWQLSLGLEEQYVSTSTILFRAIKALEQNKQNIKTETAEHQYAGLAVLPTHWLGLAAGDAHMSNCMCVLLT